MGRKWDDKIRDMSGGYIYIYMLFSRRPVETVETVGTVETGNTDKKKRLWIPRYVSSLGKYVRSYRTKEPRNVCVHDGTAERGSLSNQLNAEPTRLTRVVALLPPPPRDGKNTLQDHGRETASHRVSPENGNRLQTKHTTVLFMVDNIYLPTTRRECFTSSLFTNPRVELRTTRTTVGRGTDGGVPSVLG